jgi:hypothetical protein
LEGSVLEPPVGSMAMLEEQVYEGPMQVQSGAVEITTEWRGAHAGGSYHGSARRGSEALPLSQVMQLRGDDAHSICLSSSRSGG